MKTVFPSAVSWFQRLSSTMRTLLTILGLCVGLLVVSWASRMPIRPATPSGTDIHPSSIVSRTQEIDTEMKRQWERIRDGSRKIAGLPSAAPDGASVPTEEGENFGAPLIAHAADLEVTTKEFAHSRSALEEIVDRHHGYAAKLRMVGQPAGSLLTATLRVPSTEFSAAVTDLKTLGNVEREEQTADEITQERADLEARLSNAQRSLANLQGILAKGGKVTDLAQVQRQLSVVSAEIARLEAQRLANEHRVIFAQVLFSLREVVAPPVESLSAEFHNAALLGFSEALGTLSEMSLFVISRGPVILLWVVLIYFPARWAWRKWRMTMGSAAGMARGV